MDGKDINWAGLAKNPKFVELHTKKKTFLVTLWCFGSVAFYLLPICAGYYPELMKMKILGRLNFGYFFCLLEFAVIWVIALYYAYRSNNFFDPLTRDVIDVIEKEAQK
ncbi:MAG TPA: DUF485 domain-containing protein [Geobacter sp.]|nr:DUF485 domain-containing protein [Geobacter sp.]